jgi:hypothetical protein
LGVAITRRMVESDGGTVVLVAADTGVVDAVVRLRPA